jgi:hypothetical protein
MTQRYQHMVDSIRSDVAQQISALLWDAPAPVEVVPDADDGEEGEWLSGLS